MIDAARLVVITCRPSGVIRRANKNPTDDFDPAVTPHLEAVARGR